MGELVGAVDHPVPPVGQSLLRRALDDVADKTNPRVRFIGYTRNERLDRRTALVYGDDIGLSSSRARRAMELVQQDLGLADDQVEYEGLGYVVSKDVANTGFIQYDDSRVEVAILYDQLAALEEDEGLEIERIDQLAQRYYGDAGLWRLIASANRLEDPISLSAGTVLRIPPLSDG